MEKRWIGIAQTVCKVLRVLTAVMLLLVAVGCRILELESPWEAYYNAEKHGPKKEKILKHFNMHRGRWWNYYTRGACYLEHGHYKEAHDDFDIAIKIRPNETRDARMYGMHFMDYFPHREKGIAFYLEGMSKIGEGISEEQLRNAKEKLLSCAITKLTASLAQEESSRAKYYLNQANKALWQTSRNDRIPPVIHVKGSIYTNKRIFRLGVTVTDDQSGVEEIRIQPTDGGVVIDRPRLLVELAQKKVTETVELTINSQQKEAFVEIKAFDLAGNPSDPYKIRIIVDTHAPMASVTVVGDAQWRGRFAAFVLAVDDSGLQEIQTGGDQNDRLSCFGKQQYEATVFGTLVRGELNIRVVDVAGNAVVTSIPVEQSISRVPMPRTPWRHTPRIFPLMNRIAEYDWDRCFSSVHLADFSFYPPRNPRTLYLGGDAHTTSLASFGVWPASEVSGETRPEFHFDSHVKRPDGKAKETSQDFFDVEGILRNAQGVTGIKVDGEDINLAMLEKTSTGRNYDLLFNYRVDLSDVPIDRERSRKVTYFQDGDRSADPTILRVKRKNNCVRDRDAVYRAVLVLRVVPTAYRLTGPIRRNLYDAVIKPLKKLRTLDPYSRKFLQRLKMVDVHVAVDKDYLVAREMSLGEVFSEVKPVYDLFIYGDIGLNAGGKEEALSIVLRAMDPETKDDLQFQPLENEPSVVLAEARVPYKAFNKLLDPTDWIKHTDILANKVGKKLPRIQAEATLPLPRAAKSTVSINSGTENRLFPAMSLCFYTYGDQAQSRNVYLKKIGYGRIADTDSRSSRIVRPQLDLALIERGLITITK